MFLHIFKEGTEVVANLFLQNLVLNPFSRAEGNVEPEEEIYWWDQDAVCCSIPPWPVLTNECLQQSVAVGGTGSLSLASLQQCVLPKPWTEVPYVGFVTELRHLQGCDFFSLLHFSYPYVIFKVMISNTREIRKVLVRLSLSLSCTSKGRGVLGSALLLGSVFKGRFSLCVCVWQKAGPWPWPVLWNLTWI